MKEARLICIGKLKTACWQDACLTYERLLRQLRPVNVTELKDGKGADLSLRKKQEGERILASLKSSDWPVGLDQSGRQLTSPEFAQFLRDCDERMLRCPAFIIGGPFGLAQDVLNACKLRLSLSAMTWPHELARVLVLEQIYRGESILRGFPYHH